MSSPTLLTVSQLTRDIKGILEQQFPSLGIRGEISNFKRHSSGHMYFTLKDDGAEISAVMFRGSNQYVAFQPQDGLNVNAYGRISVFEKRGQYQLVVQRLEQAGLGALFQAYEALKKKLSEEGLFSSEVKKVLPRFPQKIAVITSGSGAAVRDILQVLERRAPHVEIVLRPALVQGPDAQYDLERALQDIQHIPDVDVVIIGRGGGSIEDLWPFNEERVARAIFASSVPVISAVGHETDTTIADFVADHRAPTPSAAAEIVSPSRQEIVDLMDQWKQQSDRTLRNRIQYHWQFVDHLRDRIQGLNPVKKIELNREIISHAVSRMSQSIQHRVSELVTQITGLREQLNALNPESILHRGYSIARTWPAGKIIRSALDVKVGGEFTLQTGKGLIRAERVNEQDKQTKLPFEN